MAEWLMRISSPSLLGFSQPYAQQLDGETLPYAYSTSSWEPCTPPPNSGACHPLNPRWLFTRGFGPQQWGDQQGGMCRVQSALGGPMRLCFVCFHLVSSYLCKMQALFLREPALLGSAG